MTESSNAEIAALKAEISSLKDLIGNISPGTETGLDFSAVYGQDDFEMPVVPIGGENRKPFDIEIDDDGNKKLVRCTFMSDEELYEIKDKVIPEGTKWIWLKTVIEEPGRENQVEGGVHDQKLNHSIEFEKTETEEEDVNWKPIYKLTDELEVEIDFRSCIYENGLKKRSLSFLAPFFKDTGHELQNQRVQIHVLGCSDTELVLAGLIRNAEDWYIAQGSNEVKLCQCDKDESTEEGEGEGEGEKISTGSFHYDEKVKEIRVGVVMVGRSAYRVEGIKASDGEYRVRIELSNEGSVSCKLEKGNGFSKPSGNVSYIPVMKISGGKVIEDYRGAFVVPAYDE